MAGVMLLAMVGITTVGGMLGVIGVLVTVRALPIDRCDTRAGMPLRLNADLAESVPIWDCA